MRIYKNEDVFCTCGKAIKPGKKFCCSGHAVLGKKFPNRKRPQHKESNSEIKFCQCNESCVAIVKCKNSRFARGHSSKHRILSETHKKNISKSMEGHITSDDSNVKRSKALKGRKKYEGFGNIMSKVVKNQWDHYTKEEKQKRLEKSIAAFKLYAKTTEGRANRRKAAFCQKKKYQGIGDGVFFNTAPEKSMKRCLSENGTHYISQYPVENIEHYYMADFYLPLYNIVLEVDGKAVHNYPDGTEIDSIRTQEMEEAGYRVLRFWEGEFDAKSVWREI